MTKDTTRATIQYHINHLESVIDNITEGEATVHEQTLVLEIMEAIKFYTSRYLWIK